ncbi:MAG: 1,4-alpha-glucan branching protein GlgB [Caenispirillum bisanense]|nr:1,4-alpha-glucan branching protein GlgB [Caenispirillum bisanense]MCA1971628.1 1,4-alpha-glucan branching protein GlgB [Caenispirillum sp.]
MTQALTVDRTAIDSIVRGDHGDPFAVLGMHGGGGRPVEVRVFLPWAESVTVVDPSDGSEFALERIHDAGFFAAALTGRRERFRYRLRAAPRDGGAASEFHDVYDFGYVLGELDVHLLAEGNHLRAFERLGAHPMELGGVKGVSFAVWAPNAKRVSLVGPFNGWDGRVNPMRKRQECGVWEIFMPHMTVGEIYKFELLDPHGNLLPLKLDPYAFQCEHPPATAAVVYGTPELEWTDHDWIAERERVLKDGESLHTPMTIYEVHLGSWKRHADGNRYFTYREMADQLVAYVKDMGFTHIEVLPVHEFPFDGSWGYQPIGLFAPTSRFGSPRDFAYFVDVCHRNGIGVIIDWVPGHFPSDAHGLAYFDGTHLYEHADPRQGMHMDWNTLIYNYGRREVQNFLLANALFWIEYFHIDGLRVDAVASMLYLDYSREEGQWIPNQYGGNENLEAIAFLRRLNELVYTQGRGAVTLAEESTAWPMVSRPVYLGGLGFGFKWNMGWMHDTLSYMSKDPIHRRYHHNQMTFGLLYAFNENFVLPLSHDEVVHGKGSLIGKMPGDDWQKFANLRAYFAFMWGHPGKKLVFMGGEFGQWAEWNHDKGLDWHLLEQPGHAGVQRLMRDLNLTLKAMPGLWQRDFDWTGFEWVDASDVDNSIFSFLRRTGEDDERPVLVVSNFTPLPHQGYRIGVPYGGYWKAHINTDADIYGGSGHGNGDGVMAEAVEHHGRPYSLCLTLPPLSTLWFTPQG